MYKPKSDCCNAPMQVHVGNVEENVNDQTYICSKCGKECKHKDNKCEVLTPSPTDYLAKARELMPPKKDMIIGRPERFGFNECLSLCLPVVADLLKRVDELSRLNDTLTNNIAVEESPALKIMVETAKQQKDKIVELGVMLKKCECGQKWDNHDPENCNGSVRNSHVQDKEE